MKEADTVLFFTDPHVLDAEGSSEGFLIALEKMRSLDADLWICGGDVSMSAAGVEAYLRGISTNTCPTVLCMGNHEIDSGYYDNSKSECYSFVCELERTSVVVLDVIKTTKDNVWYAGVGEEQLSWLAETLDGMSSKTPLILVTHVPLASSFESRRDRQFTEHSKHHIHGSERIMVLLRPFERVANLCGHQHQNERLFRGNIEVLNTCGLGGHVWRGWPRPRGMDDSPAGFRAIRVDGAGFPPPGETCPFKSV